jgi:tetratricopeptide (TPR) repeat protein
MSTLNIGQKRILVLAVAAIVIVAAGVGIALKTTSKSSPSTAQLLNRGFVAEKLGNYRLAEIDYVKVIKQDPKSAIAFFDLGTVQQFKNHPYRASEYYQKAILLAPRFERALYNLAIIVSKTNPSRAEHLYKRVLRVDAGNSSAEFNLGLLELSHGATAVGVNDINLAITMKPSLRSLLVGKVGAEYRAASKK